MGTYRASASVSRKTCFPHFPYSAPPCSYVRAQPARSMSRERLRPKRGVRTLGRRRGGRSAIDTCVGASGLMRWGGGEEGREIGRTRRAYWSRLMSWQ